MNPTEIINLYQNKDSEVMDDAAKSNFDFQKVIAVVGLILMAMKFVAYGLTGSMAILTDALESIVNVVAAFIGLFALYLSAQPPDKTHPFGHGKIENISATAEGTMITVAGAIIICQSIMSLLNPGEIRELDIGIIIIAAAAVVNYMLGRAAIRKGTKTRSPALVASGKHLCSDTYSSIGIIIGLIVVYVAIWMGYDAAWLDSSIAIIFGIIIGYTGLKVIKKSIDDSMDRTDEGMIEDICDILNEYRHNDWIDIYGLRLIKYGHNLYVDMHVVLPRKSLIDMVYNEECELQDALRSRYGEAVDLSITPIPCDGLFCRYCDRDCENRTEDFQRKLDWTTESLLKNHMHLPLRVISIDDSIKNDDRFGHHGTGSTGGDFGSKVR